MKPYLLLSAVALAACSSANDDIQPGKWTCENLIPAVIKMSKNHEVKIIEITSPNELPESVGDHIVCRASAEWTQGNGTIKYGAHVTDDKSIVVEYQQE